MSDTAFLIATVLVVTLAVWTALKASGLAEETVAKERGVRQTLNSNLAEFTAFKDNYQPNIDRLERRIGELAATVETFRSELKGSVQEIVASSKAQIERDVTAKVSDAALLMDQLFNRTAEKWRCETEKRICDDLTALRGSISKLEQGQKKSERRA